MIRIRISDPRSLWSWYIWWTDKSFPELIRRFILCAMIRVILDHWSRSAARSNDVAVSGWPTRSRAIEKMVLQFTVHFMVMGILRIKKAKKNRLLCRLDGQWKKTGWPEIPKPRQSKKETDTGSSLILTMTTGLLKQGNQILQWHEKEIY